MADSVLTRDNPQLSGPKNLSPVFEVAPFAINCTPNADVQTYVEASVSGATKTAYQSDLAKFIGWGGTIPCSDATLAAFIANHAVSHAPATLARWISSIAKAHRASGLPSPSTSELVKATLRGIRRTHGTAQKQAKPLLRDDLFAILEVMGDCTKDRRDRALLLLGFAGGFRRSELTGLDLTDIEFVRQGLIVHLRRSKTDQDGEGRKIGIPFGRGRWCPVTAVRQWLETAMLTDGPLFRLVDRHGTISSDRLSSEAVCLVLKSRLERAGIDPKGFSGHSLRAGFATSAAQAGVSAQKIRQQTGHTSDEMLSRYIRDGELFLGNAAGVIL